MPQLPRSNPGSFAGWETFVAACGYAAAAAALTWPMLLHPGSVPFADYGDARGLAWSLWARANGYFEGAVNPLIAAPFGIATSQVIAQPLSDGLLGGLAQLWNEIAAMNLFAAAGFSTTSLATYALLKRLGLGASASFLAGLVFGFCPAAVMQVLGGHAAFAFNAFVPLFVLALFHNRERRSTSSAFWLAASFAAVCFTALYIGYFSLYLGLFFLIFDYVTCPAQGRRAMLLAYVKSAGFALLLLLPVELPALREQLDAPRESLARSGHVRDFNELVVFSARAWDYFIPSIDHPVLGGIAETFSRRNLHGSNLFEQTLYLGIAPMVLLASGLLLAFRGGMSAQHQGLFLFFATAALWMFLVSLPPKIGSGVPTPSFFAYEVAPMFRVYARAGLLVCLFVACAAAVVLTHWQRVLAPGRFRLLYVLALALVAFEYWSVRPGPVHPLTTPQVYRWLESQDDAIVAEYPMIRFDEAAFYTYPFWQRVHRKPMVNGASPDNARAWELYLRVNELSDPQAVRLLREAGVKYVIVHRAMYAEGPIPGPIKRYYPPDRAALAFGGGRAPAIPPGLEVEQDFGDDVVLRFTPRQER
jgi:hypothetical protein